ncbi:sigma factor regulatory protein, FecR/PupR family [Bacteriovorax sp. Seq25_V]|nr:sigma factor regulatory protein, FecR/PupR family [Bacteriovorax sp. Seq25_V]
MTFANEVYSVLYFKGDVTAYTLNEKKGFVPSKVREKQTLATPFRIETGSNSLIVIKSKSKTNKIDSKSKIDFMETGKDAVVDVKYGSILTRFINKRKLKGYEMKIKSRTAAMGVRGTTFIYYSEPRTGKNFLAVDEGAVSYKGKNSNNEVGVNKKQSIISNSDFKNLAPKDYAFQRHINWELEVGRNTLSQPEALYESFNRVWEEHKKDQEFTWQKRNKDMENKWKSMSKN